MSGILIYKREDAKRNMFAVEKYCSILGAELIFEENLENEQKTPSFVINRTNNPAVAKKYEDIGIRVFNPSSLSSLANDKKKTYDFMSENKIEIMPINYKKVPFIAKVRNGRGGIGVKLIEDIGTFSENENIICQKCASDLGKDLRVYMIGGEIITAVLRENKKSFKANICLGGDAAKYGLSKSEKELVIKISSLIDYDFIGIDFVFDKGHAVFNEIEDTVGARSVYMTSGIDIIKLYCEYIKKETELLK